LELEKVRKLVMERNDGDGEVGKEDEDEGEEGEKGAWRRGENLCTCLCDVLD